MHEHQFSADEIASPTSTKPSAGFSICGRSPRSIRVSRSPRCGRSLGATRAPWQSSSVGSSTRSHGA